MLETSAYTILGVHKGITDKDLKLAYVNLVKKYDPEKHTERFMVIQSAYDRLKNVKSRVKEDVFTLNMVQGDYLIQPEERSENGEKPSDEEVSGARTKYHGNAGNEEAKTAFSRLLFKRAHYHLVRKQFNEAIRDWSEVLEIDPTNVRARQNLELACASLGITYSMHGLHEEAVETWERALELNPDNVEVMHNIALVSEKAGDAKRADRFWTETIKRWKAKLASNNEDDYLRLIIVEALNHQAEYQEEHPEISAADPRPQQSSPTPSPTSGSSSNNPRLLDPKPQPSTGSGTGRTSSSEVRQPPTQPTQSQPPARQQGGQQDVSSRSRTVVNKMRTGAEKPVDMGPSAGALSGIERYREILNLKPEDFEAHFQLCNKLMDSKMWEEALEELQKLARKHQNNTEVLNLMGWALLNSRQKDKAFSCWKRSLAIDPKNPATRDNLVRANLSLGKSYRDKGLFTPAMVHFKQLLALMPRSPEVHLEIAATYDMKGDVRSAISAYNQVLVLDPKNKIARKAISDLRMKR
ncbi:MAG: tetratricopeptide repeat protein [Candidatus Sumerlaeia bacterium]|nr:tetratricopeptide repeat protein [Candidatus Sumerlaeia bacterium]